MRGVILTTAAIALALLCADPALAQPAAKTSNRPKVQALSDCARALAWAQTEVSYEKDRADTAEAKLADSDAAGLAEHQRAEDLAACLQRIRDAFGAAGREAALETCH